MIIFKYAIAILLGFSTGVITSGAIFSFIAVIGVVPRLAQKTKTQKYVKIYEEAIIFGGIFGVSTTLIDYFLPIGSLIAIFFSLCIGIFYGCLAVSLAEILDVFPILSRRARIQKGISFFLVSLALGKLLGSLLYFCVPGFY